MDTLTIIQGIIDLSNERDLLRDQLTVASDSISSYQAANKAMRERVDTQFELIQELRAALAKLRAELDAVKSAPIAAPSESGHMSREAILSVAREALEGGKAVFVTMDNGVTCTNSVEEIDSTSMPVRFRKPVCDQEYWVFLSVSREPADGSAADFPMLSRLELVA